jgi:hypothetical protein
MGREFEATYHVYCVQVENYMPTNKRATTEKNIDQKIKEGRGKGEGKHYKPWFYTHEVTSLGLSHNPYSHKLDRELHLLSEGELKFFYVAEYSHFVVDIKEQYPLLPREETVRLAQKNNIPHPVDPKTKEPIVVTTDFLLTLERDGFIDFHPRSFKYSTPLRQDRSLASSNTLEDLHVLEKLEIERLYWEEKNLSWRIITELDIPEPVYRNIKQFYSHYDFQHSLLNQDLRKIAKALTQRVLNQSASLRAICRECDQRFGFPEDQAVSLGLTWYLLAHRVWELDYSTLTQFVDTSQPLALKCVRWERLNL